MKLQALFLLGMLFTYTISIAQITVDVNSGNPAFPFPQFKGYDNGTNVLLNLGTNPPAGVSHAEMEHEIREAYQVMMNRASYSGDELNGVQYILHDGFLPFAEGYGFALLAAAYMADKTTFDGLWLYFHDHTMKNTTTYLDCTPLNQGYGYSNLPGLVIDENGNSSTDLDENIALALYIASKQWGDNMGIDDACGNQISYKEECLQMLTAMTDTLIYEPSIVKYISGDIGFDGFLKSGSTYNELTDWAVNNNFDPLFQSSNRLYFCYAAPSYYREFASVLQQENTNNELDWNISQFQRAAASSDWLMKQLYDSLPEALPFASQVTYENGQFIFSEYHELYDVQTAEKQALAYLWQGNPTETWNPETHFPEQGGNTFQFDMAVRFATFLKDPTAEPWNNTCQRMDLLSWKGVPSLKSTYNIDGSQSNQFNLNWIMGNGASSAVCSQDLDLMADMYRECALKWDFDGQMEDSIPKYTHGWFRLLGMLVLTGNYQKPSAMNNQANLAVFVNVNKTVAYANEEVEIEISFKNYGTADATNCIISLPLSEGIESSSISNGGTFNSGANGIDWNIGTVSALSSDTVRVTVVPTSTTPEYYCPIASISANGLSTVRSNSQPNERSAIYKQNCIDILEHGLQLTKSFDKDTLAIEDTVTATIRFSVTEQGMLLGGRPDVNFSAAIESDNVVAQFKLRILHNADEPLIDYGNYRISYFAEESTNSWSVLTNVAEGFNASDLVFSTTNYPTETNEYGSWNQSLTFQFPNQLTPPSIFIDNNFGYPYLERYEVSSNFRFIARLNLSNYMNRAWANDWSYIDLPAVQDDAMYYPISPNYSTGRSIPVSDFGDDICLTAGGTISNLLVEEFDGYVWRQTAGYAPTLLWKEENILITDTIPNGFEFVDFIGDAPLGINPSYDPVHKVITWAASELFYGEAYEMQYKMIATTEPAVDSSIISKVYISSNSISGITSLDTITILAAPSPYIVAEIALQAGLNLVSLWVNPLHPEVDSVFPNAVVVKNFTDFYRADIEPYLNSLQTIEGGTAYFVESTADTILSITGTPIEGFVTQPLQVGWNLVGVPLNSSLSVDLLPAEVLMVKDFNRFYSPSNELSTLEQLEPGTGYLIQASGYCEIEW